MPRLPPASAGVRVVLRERRLGRACVFHAGDTDARRIQTDGEMNAGAPDSPAYAAREYAASAGWCRALEGAAPGRWSCPGNHAHSRRPFNSAVRRTASSRPLAASNRRYRCVTMSSFTCLLIHSARSSEYGHPGGEPQSSGNTCTEAVAGRHSYFLSLLIHHAMQYRARVVVDNLDTPFAARILTHRLRASTIRAAIRQRNTGNRPQKLARANSATRRLVLLICGWLHPTPVTHWVASPLPLGGDVGWRSRRPAPAQVSAHLTDRPNRHAAAAPQPLASNRGYRQASPGRRPATSLQLHQCPVENPSAAASAPPAKLRRQVTHLPFCQSEHRGSLRRC